MKKIFFSLLAFFPFFLASCQEDEVTDGGDVIVISSVQDMKWFYDQMVMEENTFKGKTVKMGRNIDMKDFTWDSYSEQGCTTFEGVLDGNGCTLSNLTLVASKTATSSDGYATLFSHFSGEVKNLTIDGVTATNTDLYGRASAVAGEMTAGKISGVTVKNLVATGWYRIAGLVSFPTAGDIVIENCKVENVTLKDNAAAEKVLNQGGGILGYAFNFKTLTVTGCSVKNIQIENPVTEAYLIAIDCTGHPHYCHPFIACIDYTNKAAHDAGYVTLSNNVIGGENTAADVCPESSDTYYGYGKHREAKEVFITVDGKQVWPVRG